MAAQRNQTTNITARFIALQELWKSANRGIFTQVAKQLDVSHQFVGMVYRGKRRSEQVEAALRIKGAPIGARSNKIQKAA